jgi:hypothetical protein
MHAGSSEATSAPSGILQGSGGRTQIKLEIIARSLGLVVIGSACAHAVVVGVLTPAETLIATRRLAGARPYLAVVAAIVHPEDLWQLCRDELTGVDVRADGWDIRGRWFGVVVVATPRLGAWRRGETIPWRVIATLIAPRERGGSP